MSENDSSADSTVSADDPLSFACHQTFVKTVDRIDDDESPGSTVVSEEGSDDYKNPPCLESADLDFTNPRNDKVLDRALPLHVSNQAPNICSQPLNNCCVCSLELENVSVPISPHSPQSSTSLQFGKCSDKLNLVKIAGLPAFALWGAIKVGMGVTAVLAGHPFFGGESYCKFRLTLIHISSFSCHQCLRSKCSGSSRSLWMEDS